MSLLTLLVSLMLRKCFHKLHVPHLSWEAKRAFVPLRLWRKVRFFNSIFNRALLCLHHPITLCWDLECLPLPTNLHRSTTEERLYREYLVFVVGIQIKTLFWQSDMYLKPKENVTLGLIHSSLLFNKLCSCPLTMTTIVQWRQKNDTCFVKVQKYQRKQIFS